MEYGLVLAGGGARGAFQLGVWKALRELKIKISAVSGTSVGAINGALIAQGEYKKAVNLWTGIQTDDILKLPSDINDKENVFHIRNMAEIAKGLYAGGIDMSPLEKLLRKVINESKLRRSRIDFGLTAFSVKNKKEIYKFKNEIPEGEIVDYIMASAALLGVRKLGEDEFIDGGTADNMPVNMLIKKGLKDIITVDARGIGIRRDFNMAGKNIISIRSENPQTGIMEFKREGILRSIDEGYLACMKAFGHYRGSFYSFNADEYNKARCTYSQDIINGIEQSARAFGINPLKAYTFDELKDTVMNQYYTENRSVIYNGKESIIDKITDNKYVIIKLVKILESGKNDFVKEKLSVLGKNYDAAAAIMYFKD